MLINQTGFKGSVTFSYLLDILLDIFLIPQLILSLKLRNSNGNIFHCVHIALCSTLRFACCTSNASHLHERWKKWEQTAIKVSFLLT